MFKVVTRTPSKVLREEYWMDNLRAEIRREVINQKYRSDDFTGAIVEEVNIMDLNEHSNIEYEIEMNWIDRRSLSDISFHLFLTPEMSIYYEADVSIDINEMDEVSFKISIADFVFVDEDESLKLDLSYDVRGHIREMTQEYCDRDQVFSSYDNDEVNESNRRSWHDSHQDPKTL